MRGHTCLPGLGVHWKHLGETKDAQVTTLVVIPEMTRGGTLKTQLKWEGSKEMLQDHIMVTQHSRDGQCSCPGDLVGVQGTSAIGGWVHGGSQSQFASSEKEIE